MRTLRMFGMVLLAILSCVNFTSCSSEHEVMVNDEEQEIYTVKLGWGGEILEVKDEPLSRVTTSDLYGIQVYSTPNEELEEGETANWTAYAYGLFDDPESITINLLKGYKYKFVATMVVKGKNIIENHLNNNLNNYHRPFYTSGDESGLTPLSNQFAYKSSTYLSGLGEGYTSMIPPGYYKHPNTERYYGKLEGFVPAENSSVSISMKRVCFGASFVAINSIAKSGTLEILMENAPKMELDFSDDELDEFWVKDIFTFGGVSSAYAKDDYTEKIPVTINWHREDGGTVPLGTHDITYKRNRNTIVTILIKKGGTDSELGFSIDESETTDIDNMTEDGNTTIEDGEIVSTPVETE